MIRAEEISAVSGIVIIISMLDDSPLIVSSAIKAVENRCLNVRPRAYRNIVSVNSLPRKARISVFVIVPAMSRPIFMPDRKRSSLVIVIVK